MAEGPLLSTADVYRTKGSHTIMVSCVDKEKLKIKLHYFPDRFLDSGPHFSASQLITVMSMKEFPVWCIFCSFHNMICF